MVSEPPFEGEYPEWVERDTWKPIDDAVGGGAGRAVGTDALAWYESFHLSLDHWGIYIPVSSLAYLECRVFAGLPLSREEKWTLGLQVLLTHERMHFAVDYVCAQWELLLRTPCWAALNHAMKAKNLTYVGSEERLANAFMLRRCCQSQPDPVKRAILRFVESQPPGYRDGLSSTQDDSFASVCTEVVKIYVGLHSVERDLDIVADSYEHERVLPTVGEIESDACPIHLVSDEKRCGLPQSALHVITCIPHIAETETFQRQLERIDPSLQRSWAVKKRMLASGITRSMRFEKIKGTPENVFSIRLNKGYRAHLRFASGGRWEAVAVGSHRDMGHG